MHQIELRRKPRSSDYNEPWGFSYKGGNNSPLIVTEVTFKICLCTNFYFKILYNIGKES